MRYISAPWRAAYVRKALSMKRCIFCEALNSRDDRAAAVLYRGRRNFILLNRYPYTPGHLLIAPKRHVADFAEARPAEREEWADLLQVALRVLRVLYAPHGFLWSDGQGVCLFVKRLEHGRFIWPLPADGVVTISAGPTVPFREVGRDRARGSDHLVREARERGRDSPGDREGEACGLEGGGEGDELVGWGLEHGYLRVVHDANPHAAGAVGVKGREATGRRPARP